MKESTFKRSRLEIYYHILRSGVINEKHTKVTLNRHLLIPYSLLNECLIYLEQAGFIDIDYYERTIKTTLKGQDYVRKFGYLLQQVGDITRLTT